MRYLVLAVAALLSACSNAPAKPSEAERLQAQAQVMIDKANLQGGAELQRAEKRRENDLKALHESACKADPVMEGCS